MDQKPQQNLGSMIESILTDMSSLIRGHIELAKTEIQDSIKNALQSSALFIIAFGFGHFAVILLLISAGYGLVSLGLPAWAAFLVVAITVLVLGVLTLWLAIRRLKRVRGPQQTLTSLNETTQTFKSSLDWVD